MSTIKQVTKAITAQGVLPLYFHESGEISREVLKICYRSGLRVIEYTNRGEKALSNFVEMAALKKAEMPELLLGVGTITNLQQATNFLDAGADFLVSPGFVPEVAAHCVASDVFYMPGCITPTEIITAQNAGIDFIKLFPGNIVGTEYLHAIKPLFPSLSFMPSGGVELTKESIESWFKAGADAVGIGGKLINKSLMDKQDYQTIGSDIRRVMEIIRLWKIS